MLSIVPEATAPCAPVRFPAALPDLAAAYIASCRSRRLSPPTIRGYQEAIALLPGVQVLSIEDIEAVLQTLGLYADSSVASYWRRWNSFFNWISKRYGTRNILAAMDAPVDRQAARRVFTETEILKLWDAATSERDKALLFFMLDTGARIGEVAALRRQDVQEHTVILNSDQPDAVSCHHCVRIRAQRAPGGKSGQRAIPIEAATARLLSGIGDDVHIWLSQGDQAKLDRNALVERLAAKGHGATEIARRLRKVGYQQVSEARVRQLLKRGPGRNRGAAPLGRGGMMTVWRRLAERAGISGIRRGPHTLRHTFATVFLRREGRIEILQRILGHKDISTTGLYTHLVVEDLRKDHQKASAVALVLQARKLSAVKRPPQERRQVVRIRPETRKHALAMDHHQCQACGSTENLTVDHILPRSRGGTNHAANLRTLCASCNGRKGDQVTPDMWATARRLP
ncbi:MAG: tyrosine-type recombinase/integrase [Dehalococcoidia bacterium]